MINLTRQQDQQHRAGEKVHNRPVSAVSDATTRSAERTPRREERERLRQDRVIGHAVVGVSGFVVFVALLPIVGSLGTFVVAVAAFYLGLRSFTFAISIRMGDPWGWTRDQGMTGPLRWSDRVVLVGVAWFRRRSEASVTPSPAGAVRVLPPEPTD